MFLVGFRSRITSIQDLPSSGVRCTGMALLSIGALLMCVVSGGCIVKPSEAGMAERPVEKTLFLDSPKETSQLLPTLCNTDMPLPTHPSTLTCAPSSTQTLAPVLTATLPAGATRLFLKDGMVSVFIPAGEFLMGSLDDDKEAYPNEKPQHKVYLDGFWIDKTEVTNEMYRKCVISGACQRPNYGYGADQHPVVGVSWYEANEYCTWAGRRLPSEAQWEKAARGSDGRKYPWGNQSPDKTRANYGMSFYEHMENITAVDRYPKGASPYGVLDLSGNVVEWVNDWYAETYYQSSPYENPQGAEKGFQRVLRGGSEGNHVRSLRAAFRYWSGPDGWYTYFGFRCAGAW